MIRCCNGCVAPKRHLGCHSTCPDYIKEKRQHDEACEVRRKAIKQRRSLDDIKFANVTRIQSRNKRRG